MRLRSFPSRATSVASLHVTPGFLTPGIAAREEEACR